MSNSDQPLNKGKSQKSTEDLQNEKSLEKSGTVVPQDEKNAKEATEKQVSLEPTAEGSTKKQNVSDPVGQGQAGEQAASDATAEENAEKQDVSDPVGEENADEPEAITTKTENKPSIRVFDTKALGESHKASKKPCQDACLSFEDHEQNLYIGLVSDGHGSSTYFRSDRGSQLLVEVAKEKIIAFVRDFQPENKERDFVQIPVRDEVKHQDRKLDDSFRNLFSSIIAAWNEKIYQDWQADPISEADMKAKKVSGNAILAFKQNQNIELAYGCTLIAFARTTDYWFSFQLGDGTCIIFDQAGKWSQPIPADPKCVGNITTSMCEPDALNNFRYCLGVGNLPMALFYRFRWFGWGLRQDGNTRSNGIFSAVVQ